MIGPTLTHPPTNSRLLSSLTGLSVFAKEKIEGHIIEWKSTLGDGNGGTVSPDQYDTHIANTYDAASLSPGIRAAQTLRRTLPESPGYEDRKNIPTSEKDLGYSVYDLSINYMPLEWRPSYETFVNYWFPKAQINTLV